MRAKGQVFNPTGRFPSFAARAPSARASSPAGAGPRPDRDPVFPPRVAALLETNSGPRIQVGAASLRGAAILCESACRKTRALSRLDDSPTRRLPRDGGRIRSAIDACVKLMFAHQNFFLRHQFPWPMILPLLFKALGELAPFALELGADSEGRFFALQQIFELRTSQICAIHHE